MRHLATMFKFLSSFKKSLLQCSKIPRQQKKVVDDLRPDSTLSDKR